MYSCAGFDDGAKCDLLRVAAMKIPLLATFAGNRRVSTYDELKKAVKDFDSGTRAFRSNGVESQSSAVEWRKEQKAKNVKLLVCPDAKMPNVDSRIDTLAEQLSSLTLLLKNDQSSFARVGSLDGDP